MQCPNCFAEIPNDVLFCDKCGEKIDYNAVAGNEATDNYTIPQNYTSGGSDDYEALSLMDSIKRPFQDPEAFKKTAIGGLIHFIPIVGPIMAIGYNCEYISKIIDRRDSRMLPTWNDLLNNLSVGVFPFLASLIYAFIMMVPSMILMFVTIGGIGAFGSIIEKMGDNNPGAVAAGCSALAVPIAIIFLFFFAFSMIAPLIEIFYAKNRNFGEAFNIMGMIRLIMVDPVGYIMILLTMMGIGMLFSIVLVPLNYIPLLGQAIFIIVVFGIRLATISAMSEFYYKNHEKAGV